MYLLELAMPMYIRSHCLTLLTRESPMPWISMLISCVTYENDMNKKNMKSVTDYSAE